MIEKQYKTLINELDNIVDKKHINQVKKVIEDLTKINNFTGELLQTLDIDIVYKKISIFLSTNFHIFNYKVTQNIHNIEEIKFQHGDEQKYSYIFIQSINKLGSIEFSLDAEHLDTFDKVYLNTFLEEITTVLYMKYVLSELQNSIFVDHLTKLKNRQSFEEDMKNFIPLVLREKMNLAVLIVNIDRFRAVNDEHGTKFGDDFLKLYANVIKETIRNSDIAVRFGGGEFLVVLVNVLDEDKALEIANKLKNKLTETYLLTSNNDQFKKTVCIGISMFPEDSSDINDVIKKAEMALIDAQDKGRNNIVRFIEPDNGEIEFF